MCVTCAIIRLPHKVFEPINLWHKRVRRRCHPRCCPPRCAPLFHRSCLHKGVTCMLLQHKNMECSHLLLFVPWCAAAMCRPPAGILRQAPPLSAAVGSKQVMNRRALHQQTPSLPGSTSHQQHRRRLASGREGRWADRQHAVAVAEDDVGQEAVAHHDELLRLAAAEVGADQAQRSAQA